MSSRATKSITRPVVGLFSSAMTEPRQPADDVNCCNLELSSLRFSRLLFDLKKKKIFLCNRNNQLAYHYFAAYIIYLLRHEKQNCAILRVPKNAPTQ